MESRIKELENVLYTLDIACDATTDESIKEKIKKVWRAVEKEYKKAIEEQ